MTEEEYKLIENFSTFLSEKEKNYMYQKDYLIILYEKYSEFIYIQNEKEKILNNIYNEVKNMLAQTTFIADKKWEISSAGIKSIANFTESFNKKEIVFYFVEKNMSIPLEYQNPLELKRLLIEHLKGAK